MAVVNFGAAFSTNTEVNMLVLSRKEDGRIYIGDDIVLTVIDVKGGRVRIGIDAPKEVKVLRDDAKETDRAKD